MQKLALLVKKVDKSRSNYCQVDVRPVCSCEIHPVEQNRLMTQEEYQLYSGHTDMDDPEFAGEITVTEWSQEGKRIKKRNPKTILVLDFYMAATHASNVWMTQFYSGYDVDKFFAAQIDRKE